MKLMTMALSTIFLVEVTAILLFRTILIGSSSMCEDNETPTMTAYVDPSDMGSYSHSLQINKNVEDNKCPGPKDVEQEPSGISRVEDKNEARSDGACPCDCEICRHFLNSELIYSQRLVGSILRQMNVQDRNFGPRESITIDLQAELSYEDLSKLNAFLMNTSKKKMPRADPQSEIKWTTELAAVTDIIGNLFHIVQPLPAVTLIEYLKENVNFEFIASPKFWIYASIGTLVVFIVVLLLRSAYMSSHPVRAIFYSFGIFYVISCVIVFYDLYENARTENIARLNQYEKVPKDCKYNDLGFTDSIAYYFRVHIFRHKDQCTDYHKQIRGDKFFHVTPIEAISETTSKLVFHSMEYIGDRLGKFFGGLLGDVPWLLKPFLLVIICTFLLLAIFRYRIKMPFISIEPSPQRPAIYPNENQPIQAPPHEAICAQPTRECSDATTSTADFEEYLQETSAVTEFDSEDS